MRLRLVFVAIILVLSAVRGYTDGLDSQIQAEITRQHVPGLTLAVIRHGAIVRLGAYGYGDMEWQAKTTNCTRFEIASISKMFTGAAIRILIDEGKLDPEDLVSKYFDGVPESWKTMRVRHLLTMSTGLGEDWGSDLIPYAADVTTPANDADMLKMFMTMKPVAPMGTEFHYSSPGYAMLGMIVAKISGESLAKFIDERIFQAAHMTQSSFIDNWAIIPERAQGYRMDDEGHLLKGWYLGQYLHSRADCGIITTARDLAKWIIALEKRTIVKDPEKLWAPSVADSGRPLDYSYGWTVDTFLGHRRLSHSGGYRTGFHTFIARYPDDDLSVIALSNCDFSDVRNYVLMTTLNHMKETPDPVTESAKRDEDPAETAAMVSAVRALAEGKIEPALMNPDALEPLGIGEVSGFINSVKSMTFAGRRRLPAGGLRMHDHTLVDYETLKVQLKEGNYFLTLYRDGSGKIVYLELTT